MTDASIEDEDIPHSTGRFGTGFITTHLLSKVIHLTSIYKLQKDDGTTQYRHFKITLNRECTDIEVVIRE